LLQSWLAWHLQTTQVVPCYKAGTLGSLLQSLFAGQMLQSLFARQMLQSWLAVC
jgi:hypothetical protein